MFAGIDVASERHLLARLDARGVPIGRPVPVTEDREGYDTLLRLWGPPPALAAMEATGHYWKNLYAALVAAGHHVALLNPLKTRRFQDSALERTKTDAIDATGLARFAFEKRPEPTQLHDAAAEALRELVRHRERVRQDFDDRVRQLHRLVDLGFPEFTRYVRGLDSMLATALLAECPTARDFAQATPRRLAKLRYDGRHLVGAELATQLVEAAKRSVGNTTARPTGSRPATSARTSTCGAGAWPRSSATLTACSTLTRSASSCSPSRASARRPRRASSPPWATRPASRAPRRSRLTSAWSPASSSPARTPAAAPPARRSATPACARRCGCPRSAPCAATLG